MEKTYNREAFFEVLDGELYKDYSNFHILKQRNNYKKFKHIKSILVFGDLERERPELSIVIPTFRRAEVLKDAVNSALNQEQFSDFEIIVVDNEGVFNYETETEKLLKSYQDNRLYYYKNEENIGQKGNWNRCLELARGKWICFLQNDDALLPNCCKECMDCIHQNDKIQGVAVRLNYLIRSKTGKKRIGRDDIYWRDDFIMKLIKASPFYKNMHDIKPIDYFFDLGMYNTTAAFYKKENVIKLGGYISEAITCDDALFNEQYIMYFGMKRIEKVLALGGQGGNASSLYESGCVVVNDYYYYDMELAKKCKLPMKSIFVNALAYRKIRIHSVKMMDVRVPLDKSYPGSWKEKIYKLMKKIYCYLYLVRK